LLASNLDQGRVPYAGDQIALYVCAHALRTEISDGFERLPLDYCDTLFRDQGLVWSITQGKDEPSRFLDLKRAILTRNGQRSRQVTSHIQSRRQ
jgi:hypothetical protein